MTDISRKRGDTYADEFVLISDTTGLPVDVTGFTFLLTVDPSNAPVNSSNNVFQIAGVLTDPEEGLVSFSPSTMQADNLGDYFYDIQMTDASGKIRTVKTGSYQLTQDITK